MANNVVAFAPRRQEVPALVPALSCAELRLSEDGHAIELTLLDAAGNVEILEYALVSPPGSDLLDRLRRAWDLWSDSPPPLVS